MFGSTTLARIERKCDQIVQSFKLQEQLDRIEVKLNEIDQLQIAREEVTDLKQELSEEVNRLKNDVETTEKKVGE